MNIIFGSVGVEQYYIPEFIMRHQKRGVFLRDEVKKLLLLDMDFEANHWLLRHENGSIPGSQSCISAFTASSPSLTLMPNQIPRMMIMIITTLKVMILHYLTKN